MDQRPIDRPEMPRPPEYGGARLLPAEIGACENPGCNPANPVDAHYATAEVPGTTPDGECVGSNFIPSPAAPSVRREQGPDQRGILGRDLLQASGSTRS